jgi:exonuclease SbcD
MKLLVTADLHLGRRPSYVPESEAEAWSCTSVWQAVVEAAIVREVDALLLVGDVVDESNRYF